MTHCNLIQPTEVDGIAPLPGVRDLLHLDGHCFLGDAGLLAVALTEPSLARLRRSASPTHWLLPLERPAVAAAATALPGEVFWLGSRPPEHLLGALAAEVLGVWRDGANAVVRLSDRPIRLALSTVPPEGAVPLHLARVFVDVWMGSLPQMVAGLAPAPSLPHSPARLAA
jgi:hypothetical protein